MQLDPLVLLDLVGTSTPHPEGGSVLPDGSGSGSGSTPADVGGMKTLQHDKELLESQLDEVSTECGRLQVWNMMWGAVLVLGLRLSRHRLLSEAWDMCEVRTFTFRIQTACTAACRIWWTP